MFQSCLEPARDWQIGYLQGHKEARLGLYPQSTRSSAVFSTTSQHSTCSCSSALPYVHTGSRPAVQLKYMSYAQVHIMRCMPAIVYICSLGCIHSPCYKYNIEYYYSTPIAAAGMAPFRTSLTTAYTYSFLLREASPRNQPALGLFNRESRSRHPGPISWCRESV